MQSVYWLCFLVGGTFVTLAIWGGLDGAEFEYEVDTDVELKTPDPIPPRGSTRTRRSSTFQNSKRVPIGLRFGISVLTSLRFWTVSACFFGLTGLLLSGLYPGLGARLILAIAFTMGLFVGGAIASTLMALHYRRIDSLVRSSDLAGLIGIVEIPFNANSKGKVRVNVRGSLVEFVARTDEAEKTFEVGDRVLIVGTDGPESNRLWVVSTDRSSDPNPA
ncbi:MAG: NfeD-like protein [Merismopedia sp. SIO2A8]|nr:NfeD-like protein [Merismopedia sp. SIO2A8]